MAELQLNVPVPGTVWRHYDGLVYNVCDIANLWLCDAKNPLIVNYVGINGRRWAKTLVEWHRAMRPEGRTLEDAVESVSDARVREIRRINTNNRVRFGASLNPECEEAMNVWLTAAWMAACNRCGPTRKD